MQPLTSNEKRTHIGHICAYKSSYIRTDLHGYNIAPRQIIKFYISCCAFYMRPNTNTSMYEYIGTHVGGTYIP